ncbi:hypothetical protein [Bacillus sp. ISL-47]|uniref:hypothetical protein n=1 Tax=Bacillus sp. ISL-47 TaxID=2819130 RepID=UPI001BEAEFE8|nr:hypothetical protein [Bacillus sp. ISL-47]MBT2710001.1 hypothetical protein [Pseudomonas sp. ISL-84]
MKKWMGAGLYIQGIVLLLIVYYGFFTGLVAAETKITEIEGKVEEKYLQASIDNYLSNYNMHQEYWIRMEGGESIRLTASLYKEFSRGKRLNWCR